MGDGDSHSEYCCLAVFYTILELFGTIWIFFNVKNLLWLRKVLKNHLQIGCFCGWGYPTQCTTLAPVQVGANENLSCWSAAVQRPRPDAC